MTTVYRLPGSDPATIVARARSAIDRCACAPFRAAFEECLLPGARWPLDVPFRIAAGHTQGVSTCGLVALWCWGVDLDRPYQIGSAFARIQHHGQAISEPEPGAIILTPTHAIVVVEYVPEYGYLETVEGGQLCLRRDGGHEGRGLQAIHLRRDRVWPMR